MENTSNTPAITVPGTVSPVWEYDITKVADCLARVAAEKDLTLPELESISGVPAGTIHKMFKHTTADPRFETVSRVAYALGVSLDTLTSIALPEVPDDVPVVVEDAALTRHSLTHMIAAFYQALRTKDEMIALLTEQLKTRKLSQLIKDIMLTLAFAGLIFYLLWDVTHPTEGLIQYQVWHDAVSGTVDKLTDYFSL